VGSIKQQLMPHLFLPGRVVVVVIDVAVVVVVVMVVVVMVCLNSLVCL
jgi:hypothetical protein